MIQLTLNMLLQVVAVGAAGHDYATAYYETRESGRPLVVLVGADWCPGCVQMKHTSLPEVEKKGGLSKVAIAYVNTDQQSQLARKLMKGGSIPQLVMFHKTETGWKRQQLTGAHSASAIQAFLDRADRASDQPVAELSSRKQDAGLSGTE
jgi:thioredoxin-like negative regulator of GroEL